MAEKKDSGFTVTDRRLFTPEGELRKDAPEDATVTKLEVNAAAAASQSTSQSRPDTGAQTGDVPAPPTAAEQQQQADAYRKSSKDLDTRVELSGHSADELQMTFERFMASLYMTAMMQLGLMHEEGGQPRVDLIGARQTIDTLALMAEKTKGNLTTHEEHFLQNCLYELRMAYVEMTNTLTRGPQAAVPKATPNLR